MKKQLLTFLSLLITGIISAQVGIGTTTPTQALDIETNEAGGTAIDINNTGTGDPKINLQLNGTTTFSIGVDNDDSDKLKIGTSAPETNTRITIDNTGNVGVGTATPDQSAVLDAFSTTKGFLPPRLTTTQRNAITNPATGLLVFNTTTGFVEVNVGSTIAPSWQVISPGATGATGATGSQGPTGLLTAGTTAGNTPYWNGTSWVVNSSNIFNNGGNIGIGTTSPSAKLHLDGTFRLVDGTQAAGRVLTSDANGVATWQAAAGGSLPAGTSGQTLRHDGTTWVANSNIFNNGTNVGIGTSTPNAPLQFANSLANRKNVLWETSNNDHQFYGFGINSSVLRYQVDATVANHIFYAGTSATTSNELMRIQGNGRVGIGEINPSTTLHVAGSFRLVNGTQAAGRVLTSDANGVATWQAAGGLPAGTSGQTLRHNGANWVANSNIFNNGTNIGIGTTDPARTLDVVGSASVTNAAVNQEVFRVSDGISWLSFVPNLAAGGFTNISGAGDMGLIFSTDNNAAASAANGLIIGPHSLSGTSGIKILENGNVGVGTLTPGATLDVNGSAIFNEGGAAVNFRVESDANADMLFINGTNNRIGIGTNSPDQILSVNGNASKTGGGTWATFSDKRLKKNINEFTDGLDKLMQINPVSFQYNGKAGYTNDSTTFIGVIAQDVEKVAPYMIEHVQKKLNENDSLTTDLLMYDGSALTYILVNAVKEQQSIIETQKAEIDVQKAEIEALKQNALKISELENKINAMILLLNNKEELTVKQD
jgi:hypothetical protein